jgi:hypothetical protein
MKSKHRRNNRSKGTAALEEIMILAVMMPVAAACFFLCLKICKAIYGIIAALVGWPYL